METLPRKDRPRIERFVMRRRIFAASLACLQPVMASASDGLPAAVRQAVSALDQTCRDAGGRPSKSSQLVQNADLNGDGRPDYVVFEGAYVCDGAASLFSSDGGSAVTVFASGPNGAWAPAFSGAAQEIKIEAGPPEARLWLVVGGAMCGQTKARSRGDAIACWRPLKWSAARQRMDLAPVSQSRPYG